MKTNNYYINDLRMDINIWEQISFNTEFIKKRRIVTPVMLLDDQLESHNITIQMVFLEITISNNGCAMILGGAESGNVLL